jgi:hypothetical protein
MVHKDRLSAKSKFFKAAIAKKWKEGEEEILRLPEVEPDIFQTYADWAYSNVVTPVHSSTKSLIKLYLIGDFLDDLRLRIKTMELLVASVKSIETFPKVNAIKMIWDNTTANSLLRSWILDLAIRYYDRASFAKHAERFRFPADFVLQVTLKILPEQSTGIDPSFMTDASKYLEVEVID